MASSNDRTSKIYQIPDPMKHEKQFITGSRIPTNQPDYSYQEAIKLLSPSEIRVLDVVERGYTNKEIAIELCLSVETIKTHKKNICKKLGLYGRNGLLKWLLSTINGRNE